MTEQDQPGEDEMLREHQYRDMRYRNRPYDPSTAQPVHTETRLTSSGGAIPARTFQALLLGMAGHDLRQPLQVIQSTHEWLESRVGAPEKVRLMRSQRAITRLVEQLDGLIGAMCLLERTSDVPTAPTALMAVLQRVV